MIIPINTPMMRYQGFKEKHPDAIFLVQVGETYQCYNEDAENVSKVTGVALTRDNDRAKASFPRRALDIYLPRLVRAGYRIAIMEDIC